MNDIQKYLLNEIKLQRLDAKKGAELLRDTIKEQDNQDEIAIIGIGLRMPMADNKEEFWDTLSCKLDTVREYPRERHGLTDDWLSVNIGTENAYQKQGYLNHIEGFDAAFFGISPAEAKRMNPAQRLFMQCAYEALEDAGYGGNRIISSKTSVFAGVAELGQPRYENFLGEKDGTSFLGNANSIIPTRISYYLGLAGPSMVVDSACSSSLLGVHLACESLVSGESDMAIACGVSLNLMPLNKERVTILESPTKQIHPFGEEADGTVWGEGIGVVVLKKLKGAVADKDRIYAVIRGHGANNDGNSNGITAPKLQSQQELFESVWNKYKIDAKQIRYVEAHGTGTKMGDPIEIKSLSNAMRKHTKTRQFCGIGTVKAGIGHLVAASGVAALIKSALSMYYNQIPPMRGFHRVNSYLDLVNTPFYICDEVLKLDPVNTEELIAVNSFGISGTNVHLILGKAPVNKTLVNQETKEQLLLVSAKSYKSLILILTKYQDFLGETQENLENICYSAWKSRGHYKYRAAIIADTASLMKEKIGHLLSINDSKSLRDGCFLTGFPYKEYTSELHQIAVGYVEGDMVSCQDIYGETCRFVDIPIYAFDENVIWPEHRNSIEKMTDDSGWVCMCNGIKEDDWQYRLSSQSWYLEEHQVASRKMLPAAAMVEFMATVARAYIPIDQLVIKNFQIFQPLMGVEDQNIQMYVGKTERKYMLELYKYDQNQERQMVASANAEYHEKQRPEVPIISKVNPKPLNPNMLTDGKIQYGKRWECIQGVLHSGDNTILDLRLPVSCQDDIEKHILHPSIFDMALNGMALELKENFLPFRINEIAIFRSIPVHCYSEIKLKKEVKGEMYSYQVTIFDEKGIIAYADDYAVKKVEGNFLAEDQMKGMRQIWKSSKFPIKFEKKEKCLVLTDDIPYARNMLGEEKTLTFFSMLSGEESTYEKEDIKTLVVAYMITAMSALTDEELEEQIQLYIRKLYDIIREFSSVKKVVVITNDSFDGNNLTPIGEAVNTLLKSARNEYLVRNFKHISNNEADKKTLLNEIFSDEENEIVLWEQKRMTSVLEEFVYDKKKGITLAAGKYYLLTGGSGGLAGILAKWLVRKKCNLILTSRSGKTEEGLLKMAQESGVECITRRLDISNHHEMIAFQKDIEENSIEIDGIFHLAGTAGSHFISKQDNEQDRQVWGSKIWGTHNLTKIILRNNIRFMVCYSSVSAIIGTPGQSNYALGNAYVDGLVNTIIASGRQAISIQWPAISGIGMAAANNFDYDSIFYEMKAEEVSRVLESVLNHGSGVYCPGKINYSFTLADKMAWNLDKKLEIKFKIEKNKNVSRKKVNFLLTGRKKGDYTEQEKTVGSVWSKVLEVYELNIDSDFYSFGGNSILAINILTKLNEEEQVNINIAELFQYRTIRSLAQYISEMGDKRDTVVQKASQKEFYDLSTEQKQIYSVSVLSPESVVYNMPIVLLMEGEVEPDRINLAFQKLVQLHPSLRTEFLLRGSEIKQHVRDNVEVKVELEQGDEAMLPRYCSMFIKSFKLHEAPLIRMKLICINSQKYVLLMDIHHIVADGYSSIILMKDFIELYEGRHVNEPETTYLDYSETQNGQSWNAKDSLFWENEFKNDIPVLNLQTDFQRPAIKSYKGASLDFKMGSEIKKIVDDTAALAQCSKFMVFLAAMYLTLSKYSGQDDIVIGVPNIGRRTREYKNTVGMFVNTLPIRISADSASTVFSFLEELKLKCLDIFQHADFRLGELLPKINHSRDASRNPLYDVMLVYQNMEDDNFEISDSAMGKIFIERDKYKITSCPYDVGTSKMDVTFEVHEKKDGFHMAVYYGKELFEEPTIRRIVKSFQSILKELKENLYTVITEISAVTREQEELLNQFNETKVPYPNHTTIDAIFSQQAKKTPDAVAVWCKEESLTYKQLDEYSDGLACYLQKKGIHSGSVVGILADRSFEMIIGIYGIIKAGGAYMPIGTEYPVERIMYMLENSNADFILIQNLDYGMEIDSSVHKIDLSDKSLYQSVKGDVPVKNHNQNSICYVIYTSGTTGNPKGVMVEHHSIINRIHWMQKKYPIGAQDKILQKTTYTFDVSVWEIFWWSMYGASVVMLDPEGQKIPDLILKSIKKHQVTVIHFVPSMFHAFMDYVLAYDRKEDLKSLKILFTSGEELKSDRANLFLHEIGSQYDIRLVNKYGPTEAAVDVTYYECVGNERIIPIGKPIDNTKIYILDKNLNKVPVGVSGIIYIAGVGLARGYINNPVLTKEKFISDVFEESGKMYNTGDIARWMPDGNIEYLGRCDHQVKIRGFRIELEEIESILRIYPGIQECLVKDVELNGQKTLCAYIKSVDMPDINGMKEAIGRKLPGYMIPGHFIYLDSFPLSQNGKIDRKALPLPEIGKKEYREVTLEEDVMIKVWKEVLHTENIGIDDNFFEVGGDSIKAIQMTIELRKMGYELDIRNIIQHSVLSELCLYLEKARENSYVQAAEQKEIEQAALMLATNIENIENVFALTPLQEGILMYYQMNTNSTAYFEQFDFLFEGNFDTEVLKCALIKLVEKRAALRTIFFNTEDGTSRQVILKELGRLPFEIIEGREYSEPEEHYVERFKKEDRIKSLNIMNEVGWRITLLKLKNERYRLIWNFHHIIVDGWSEIILWNELFYLYEQFAKGQEPAVSKETAYIDYVAWMREHETDDTAQNYWTEYLKDYKNTSKVLTGKESYGNAGSTYEFRKSVWAVEKKQTECLKEIVQKNHITLNILLQAAWAVVLYYFNDENQVVFGVVNSGRQAPVKGVDDMVGLLLNTMPQKANLCGNSKIMEIAKKMHSESAENLRYSYFPLYKLQKQCEVSPVFDHIWVYQNFPSNFSNRDMKMGDVIMKEYQLRDETTYDFNITAAEIENELSITYKYNKNKFSEEDILKVKEQYFSILDFICKNEECTVEDILELLEEDDMVDFMEDLTGNL